MQNIIEAVKFKHTNKHQNPPPMEFQVFFNDHTNNDFNTLFRSLPSYQNYFAAGVPGSFRDRLFPKSFLHFAHSSYALHWLSKIPKEIIDPSSPAWNKDSIYFDGSVEEISKAYSTQFKSDVDAFLNVRAQEIVGGGFVAILTVGLPEGMPNSKTQAAKFFGFLQSSLVDLVRLGVIGEEKVDSFNVPIYLSTPKEWEEIVKRNGYFSIERMEMVRNQTRTTKPNEEISNATMMTTFSGLLKEHFGDEDIVDKISQYFIKNISNATPDDEDMTFKSNDLFVMLKRKFDY